MCLPLPLTELLTTTTSPKQTEPIAEGETELMYYVMNSTGIYPPSEGYYQTIKDGYRDFGLKLAPLKTALAHSWDAKHPTHIERKRTRRNGRPALARRNVERKQSPVDRRPG